MCSPAGAGGYNKPSPGAGLCGTGFICCTQAAPPGAGGHKKPALEPVCVGLALAAAPEPPPPGAGGYKKTQPRCRFVWDWPPLLHPSRPTGGEWVQNPAPGPVCVGLAASAAPRPPPPGAGGYKKTQPWGRVVWGWPPLLHPSRPHRGRVGTKTHSPAASLCGTGCGAAAQKENDEEKKEKRMKTGSQDKVRRTGRTVLPLP